MANIKTIGIGFDRTFRNDLNANLNALNDESLNAKSKAESVQTQLNNIIIESGTSDAEVIQARGDKPVLNERLNLFDAQLADTVQDLKDRAINVKSFGAVGDGLTDDTAAFKLAIDFAYNKAGGIVLVPSGKYVITSELTMKEGVYLEGQGTGEWGPIFTSRPKTWEGTTLLFRGTGPKTRSFPGVTSLQYGGGWRQNPDNVNEYFKLTSFMNSDANGTIPATPKMFSVAIAPAEGAMYWGIRNLRLVPYKGTDGYSAYSDKNDSSLSDAWDIGILLQDTEYVQIKNVQALGEWREFGLLNITAGFATGGRSEQNLIEKSKFQGRVGLGIRSADRWKILSKTSNTVSIYWSNESYWSTSGTFRGSDNVVYTYTGATQSGTQFTFTGVTPDPVANGIFQVRNTLGGTGFANTIFKDVMVYAFDHVHGQKASLYGIKDSKPFEMSGFPLRGISFYNFKAHTREDVVAFLHDNSDTVFIDPQFEGGGHIIASPFEDDATYAAAPSGETRNIVMIADSGVIENDIRLFLPRNAFVQGMQLTPRGDLSGDFVIKALRSGKHTIIENTSGGRVIIRKSDGVTDLVRVYDSGNVTILEGAQLNFVGGTAYINSEGTNNMALRIGTTTRFQIFGASGNIAPGADNTQTLGTSGLRWSTIYAGTGAINTSDENYKQQIHSLSDSVLDAWSEVNYQQFKFNDAVALKGDEARWHIGLVAQRIKEAFISHGLDAFDYGILCYDEWEDIYEENDEGEAVLTVPAGSRYSIRPAECLMLEAALMRREIKKIRRNL